MDDSLIVREIFAHRVDDHVSPLKIECLGVAAQGGAQNYYRITGFNYAADGKTVNALPISFQIGNPEVLGVNGVTMEALLAVVIDRLSGLQKGMYPCSENNMALGHLEASMTYLHARSRRIQQTLFEIEAMPELPEKN